MNGLDEMYSRSILSSNRVFYIKMTTYNVGDYINKDVFFFFLLSPAVIDYVAKRLVSHCC